MWLKTRAKFSMTAQAWAQWAQDPNGLSVQGPRRPKGPESLLVQGPTGPKGPKRMSVQGTKGHKSPKGLSVQGPKGPKMDLHVLSRERVLPILRNSLLKGPKLLVHQT